tara:strand:- start:1587 stop:2639 length:1053 start_codon:yes stop_codon:yes gene_type:complete
MSAPRELQRTGLFSPARKNRDRVLLAIKQAFPDNHEVPTLKLLAGGNSGNPVYQVTLGEQAVVARVTNGNEKAIAEHLISRLTGESGIAPTVIYPNQLDSKHAVMITEFVDGEPLTPINCKNHEDDMLQIIRNIHDIDTPNSMPAAFSLFDAIRQFGGEFTTENHQELLQQVDRLESLLANDTAASVCFVHNDINVNNCKINANGDIKVFDWGDGGMGDPLADLAHYTNLFGYNADESNKILNKYLQKDPTEVEAAHFNLLKYVSVLRTGMATASYACKADKTSSFKPDATEKSWDDWYAGYKAGTNKPDNAEGLHKVASAALNTWQSHQKEISQHEATLAANQRPRNTP